MKIFRNIVDTWNHRNYPNFLYIVRTQQCSCILLNLIWTAIWLLCADSAISTLFFFACISMCINYEIELDLFLNLWQCRLQRTEYTLHIWHISLPFDHLNNFRYWALATQPHTKHILMWNWTTSSKTNSNPIWTHITCLCCFRAISYISTPNPLCFL